MKKSLLTSLSFRIAASLFLYAQSSLVHADLLLWWSFDEDAGSETVVDQSGNENEGELVNFDFSEDSDLLPDGGKFGGAVHFDGFDDYVNNITGFQATEEAFTYAYFFKPDEDDYAEGHERDDHIYCNARPHFSFSRDGGGDGQLGMYFTLEGDGQVKTTTSEWSNEEWHHVAWTFDGEDVRIYVNGVEEDSIPNSGLHTVQGDGRFNIGSNAGGSAFDGVMDDMAVWDEALSAADLATIAESGVAVFLEQRNVDTDNDELPDIWEQQIIDADPDDAIVTVFDVVPAEDFDEDGSANENEFSLSTDPTDADSDDDDLADGVETDTGTWASTEDTGTDPRVADTDEDGLLDGVENPDLPYDSANAATQPGSNPNVADSDEDGWKDGAEVSLGTDPTDKNSIPAASQRLLFIGGAAGDPTAGADPAVMDFLVERYGEPNVDYLGADESDTDDELEYAALILSSTFGSGSARNKFQDSPVPIVNWEEALARDVEGEFSMSSDRIKDNSDHSIIIKQEHPITAGFAADSTVVMTDGASEFWWSAGDLAPGSISLACDDDDENNFFFQVIEQGEELLSGSPAPGKRVMLGLTDASFNTLTDDGLTLFGQMVDWALGIGAATGPLFQVTTIELAETETKLTWTSKEGQAYTVQRSTDLADWLELTDGYESEGESTSYIDDKLPEERTILYYRILEEE